MPDPVASLFHGYGAVLVPALVIVVVLLLGKFLLWSIKKILKILFYLLVIVGAVAAIRLAWNHELLFNEKPEPPRQEEILPDTRPQRSRPKVLTPSTAQLGVTLRLAQSLVATTTDPLAQLDEERLALRSLAFTARIRTPKPGGRESNFTMEFQFRSPNLYRSEIRMGIEGRLITVSDGTWLWLYETRTGKVRKQDRRLAEKRLSNLGAADPLTAVATPSVPLAALFRLHETQSDSRGPVLILKPVRAVPNYDRLALHLAADGRTPHSIDLIQKSRVVTEITFTSFRRNAAVPADRFVFTVPEGATVTEVR